MSSYGRGSSDDLPSPAFIGGGCLIAAVVIFAIYFLLGIHSVDATEVAIVKTNGSVTVEDSGVTHIMPGISSIDFVDIRKRSQNFSDLEAATREQQTVKVSGQIVFHIDRQKVSELYRNVDLSDVEGKLLDKPLQDFVKESIVQYPAADVTTSTVNPDGTTTVTVVEKGILAHRQDIRDHAVKAMQARMDENYPGIDIDDIFLANLAFSDQYEKAIEQKQEAQQQVETAKQKQAQAAIDAQTEIIKAQGEAKANKERQTGLTPEVLQQQAIAKWNGILPQVTGGSTPFVTIPTGK